jgi:hypothetical protein
VLLADDFGNCSTDTGRKGSRITEFAALVRGQHRHEIIWTGQTPGMGGEDSFRAAFHDRTLRLEWSVS